MRLRSILNRGSRPPTYDRVSDFGWGDPGAELLDILNPVLVLLETIGRESNELHATSCKVPRATSDFTKLGGANGGEVICE